MKNYLLVLLCFITFSLLAQENDNSYVMYQSLVITPKPGHGQQLRQAVKVHNAQFHREGAQTVNVWSVNSGPRIGSLLWVKGPLTWTDMDTPLEANGHMDDWRDNIMTHGEIETMEFWRLADDMIYMPEGLTPGVMLVRYFDINQQKGDNARRIWKEMFDLYKEKNWDTGLQIFTNQANTGDGRDWAIIWYHENWASMDKQRQFWQHYEEMTGKDSREFFEEWDSVATFKGMELFTLVPELSAASASSNDD